MVECMPRQTIVAFALLVVAACGGGPGGGCPAERSATPLDRSTTGTITGTVTFDGPVPPMATLQLGSQPECAGRYFGPVLAGDALVRDGLVENAFVYIKDGLGERTFAIPSEPVKIDQAGCLYQPHVVGAQTCQPIVFLNSDPILHNVHGSSDRSSSWNFSLGVQGSQRSIRVDKPEVMIKVRCDVHPWMVAYLGVLDHPYFAVTDENGRFTLADVPAGEYQVVSWHERFGTRETHVSVGPKQTAETSFTYGAAAAD
jgi:hypothetical protein